MKRVRIIIRGTVVQDIGYRLFLYERADELSLLEFQARNIKGGVEVLAGGEAAAIERFGELLGAEKPEGAEISAIEAEEYRGSIKPIERFAQSFMLTQMGKFVSIGMELSETQKEIKKDTGKMLDKQDQMLDKQDVMLDKQDLMIEKQDLMLDKQDLMIEKQDVMIETLHSNTDILKGLRSESNANFKLLHKDNRELKELISQHEHSIEERIETLATEINAEKRSSSGWKQPRLHSH